MKVTVSVDSDLKTVTVERDRVLGARLTGPIADDVFKLRDSGFKLIASQKITLKLRKFELSESGKSGKTK